MKFKFIFFLLIPLSCISCATDYTNNSRVFVEGKITSNNQSSNNLSITLRSYKYPISSGTTNNNGSFELGAPEVVEETSLHIGRKIVSFTTDTKDCFINHDSLSIVLPDNFQHVKFSNITIK